MLFRGFADWRVNVFWAIPVNYLTCVIVGSIWGGHPLALSTLPSQPWLWLALLQGGILAVNFFLLAYTAQRVGVSVAALASRLSVAIPSILAFLFYGDSFTAAKLAGLAAALLSLYLCTASTERHVDDSSARVETSSAISVSDVRLLLHCHQVRAGPLSQSRRPFMIM